MQSEVRKKDKSKLVRHHDGGGLKRHRADWRRDKERKGDREMRAYGEGRERGGRERTN